MDMGEDVGEVFDPADALRPARSENFREGVDPGWADADVIHGDTGVVGFLDGVRAVRPGVATFVALIGDQAIADHDQQASLGRLRQEPARQVAQG